MSDHEALAAKALGERGEGERISATSGKSSALTSPHLVPVVLPLLQYQFKYHLT